MCRNNVPVSTVSFMDFHEVPSYTAKTFRWSNPWHEFFLFLLRLLSTTLYGHLVHYHCVFCSLNFLCYSGYILFDLCTRFSARSSPVRLFRHNLTAIYILFLWSAVQTTNPFKLSSRTSLLMWVHFSLNDISAFPTGFAINSNFYQ